MCVCFHSVSDPPAGVLEAVLVVEGHEEAEDGEEHDHVAGEDEPAGALGDLRVRGKGRGREREIMTSLPTSLECI